MSMKVKFNDLTLSLKVFVVIGWIIFSIYGLAFIIGFIEGMLGL